jgi:hypothetical protein
MRYLFDLIRGRQDSTVGLAPLEAHWRTYELKLVAWWGCYGDGPASGHKTRQGGQRARD